MSYSSTVNEPNLRHRAGPITEEMERARFKLDLETEWRESGLERHYRFPVSLIQTEGRPPWWWRGFPPHAHKFPRLRRMLSEILWPRTAP